MCEFETATDAPITYAELEVLIRLIIEDFTLLKAAEIKKELHNLSDDKVATIGLSVQDFIDYNTKINNHIRKIKTDFNLSGNIKG